MQTDSVVFKKIKEISARGMHPRPVITIMQLATELSVTSASLLSPLAQLKLLRLVNFKDTSRTSVNLTLLGSVVTRDK